MRPTPIPRNLEQMHAVEIIYPRSLKHMSHRLRGLVSSKLWAQVLIGMVLGIGFGILIGPSVGWVSPSTSESITNWISLPGRVFLGVIQMIVLPLLFASIIRGIAAGESMDNLRRLGLATVGFFVATTALAIVIGLVLASVIEPGSFVDAAQIPVVEGDAAASEDSVSALTVPDRIVSILPSNPLGSIVNNEILAVVIFSIIFGLGLLAIRPESARPFLDLMGSVQEVTLIIVRWAMVLAPFAVFGLLAQLTARIGIDAIIGMGVYVGTVLFGLLILLVVYSIIMTVVHRKPPWWFLGGVRDVQLLAFSTSSSAAVMPITMRTAEEKLGVRSSISQFVIPLGTTINMNGTALYQGVATL
ncbi:MAG: dicarboxylate/amino acid:cation symporter, partial [Chloroflexi bacterium]|nr:dicarboxylate/amino acid:cation symporter [Chloroflexota bacterium]